MIERDTICKSKVLYEEVSLMRGVAESRSCWSAWRKSF